MKKYQCEECGCEVDKLYPVDVEDEAVADVYICEKCLSEHQE